LQRQQEAFAADHVSALVREDLVPLCRLTHPEVTLHEAGPIPGEVALVNARWLPSGPVPARSPSQVGIIGDQVAYVILASGAAKDLSLQELSRSLPEWRRTLPRHAAGGAMIDHPWNLIEHNARALEQDALVWQQSGRATVTEGPWTVVGPRESALIDPSACIEPLVLIDTTKGPVLIDQGAVVQAFSRIEGPCYLGSQAHVLGAKVRGSSIGPHCRIGGEVEGSIVQSYSNKAHDGFLGHSYLGEWVNFGAGTHTSDLRADYGLVSVTVNGKKLDTGLLKVGAFVGDHTKTSISTLLNTGTVIGPFSLLLTSGTLLPKALPAFCQYGHGRVRERTDLREMFDTATTMMARRDQEWTETHAEFFFSLYEQTASERRHILRESEQRRLRRVV
jgi:UDP-N-acetylglucosamine diphosphorylase/glucosamine-1-phosphate N-acetyltransferase